MTDQASDSLIGKLPHRSTMLLIDEVVSVDENSAVVTTRINKRRRELFGVNGTIDSYLGVELTAQAAALPLIYDSEGDAEHSGMIVQVRSFEAHGSVAEECVELLTKCEVEMMLDGRVASARGAVFCEGELLCSMSITLAVQDGSHA